MIIGREFRRPDEDNNSNFFLCYGDAGTNSNIKFAFPAMGARLRRLISRYYQVMIVDECRTSKVCSRRAFVNGQMTICGKEVDAVMVKKDGVYVEQHGVRVSINYDNNNNYNNNNKISIIMMMMLML